MRRWLRVGAAAAGGAATAVAVAAAGARWQRATERAVGLLDAVPGVDG